jgi:hypothetical protein
MLLPPEIVPLRFPSGREVEESLFDFTAQITLATKPNRVERL